MRASRIFTTALSLLMVFSTVQQAFAEQYFNDVIETDEFAPYINALALDGIVTGIGGNYYPFRNVSRGEQAKFAVNAAGLDIVLSEDAPHFDDVPETNSLYPYIETAYAYGIIRGRSERSFAPNAPVLRQEAARIIRRAFQAGDAHGYFEDLTTGGPHFTDVSVTNEFFADVETLYNLGVIHGYGNGLFGAMDPTQRGQMAKIVSRARDIIINGPPEIPVGVPTEIRLEASERELYPDGYSNASITVTILDQAGSAVGGYTQPITCTTNLGQLVKSAGDEAAMQITIAPDAGRAQMTLYSDTDEGVATIICSSGAFEDAVTHVTFSRNAPRARTGFGSNSVAGVGQLDIMITDDRIINFPYEDPYKTIFTPVVGGCALIEVYAFDDEGDPVNGDEILLSITAGQGHLQAGLCTAEPTQGVRTIQVTTSDNGRATAYVQALEEGHSGEVEITAQNLDTSPTLMTDASLTMVTKGHRLEAFPDVITARTTAQVTGDDADAINVSEVLLLLLNENGKPINDLDNKSITARFTGGPADGARFVGCNTIGCASPTDVDVETYVYPVLDSNSDQITGLYAVKILAGKEAGTLEMEIGGHYLTIDIEVPQLDCFTSSEEAGEDLGAAVVCRLTTADGVPITDETLECQIQGGDGGVDTNPADNDPSATTVTMEAVEAQTGGPGLGWYWCQYESEASIPGDDSITIRVTDLDRAELPAATVVITATDDNPGAVTQLIVEPLETNVGAVTDTSVLVIARDNDEFGISALAIAGSTASATGLVRTNSNTLTNVTISEVMTELGNGAYFFDVLANNVDDTGEAEVELYNSEDVFIEDVEVGFNILDDALETVRTRSEILVDGGLGVVTCATDENGDPIAGLTLSDWTVTNEGVVTTRSTMREIQPSSDVSGISGSGCYNLSVDTTTAVQPTDEVEIRTAITGRPTNPSDSITVSVEDVSLELMAHNNFLQATNCVLISAIVRDQDGDPIDIETPGTNGVRLQITSGSGGLKNGDVTAGNCSLSGSSSSLFITQNVGTSAVANGVYIATFVSSVLGGTTEITGYVEGANSRAEDMVTIQVE